MERFYRRLYAGENIVYFDVKCEQTDLRVGADRNLKTETIFLVKKYRSQIKEYIAENHDFLTSLKPIELPLMSYDIIFRMCEAAKTANVGPMAAVAGAINEFVGRELLQYSENVIIENGGDLFLKTNHLTRIGIYAGKSPFTGELAIEIPSLSKPIGICTSSGNIGHSLSFGKADAAMIISDNVTLSDALATAMGNLVSMPNDIKRAINFARSVPNVKGALVILDDKIGVWGNIKLVPIKH